jgi:hypothetical protein
MSKKKDDAEPQAETAPETPAGPTAFAAAMADIKAEADKLTAAGMGTHDAFELATGVWQITRGQ